MNNIRDSLILKEEIDMEKQQSYVIQKGEDSHLPVLFELVREQAEYLDEANLLVNTLEQMEREKDSFEFFVACEGSEVIGMAIYFSYYSDWVGKALYLQDIFVRPEYRGKGIGSALFDAVIENAKKNKIKSVKWQVQEKNKKAIRIYEKLGASFDSQRLNCHLSIEVE